MSVQCLSFQIAARQGARYFRCLFRVTFVPKDAYDLLKEDPIAFEYFYLQVSCHGNAISSVSTCTARCVHGYLLEYPCLQVPCQSMIARSVSAVTCIVRCFCCFSVVTDFDGVFLYYCNDVVYFCCVSWL